MLAPKSNPIRILLIDRLPVVRAALRMLLESWPGLQVVGDVASAGEAANIAEQEQPDIFLLNHDLNRNGHDLNILSQLNSIAADARIILLTGEPDPESRLKAVLHGARGVVLKEKAADELRKAIEKVHLGEMWLDRALTASVLAEISNHREPKSLDPEHARIESLSVREREVAALACQGLQNRDIAAKLFISETTVRHHFTSIFSKLGVSNRFELVIFLYRHRFAEASA
jgi:two-component system nitrate/nitrite response regulator NarL